MQPQKPPPAAIDSGGHRERVLAARDALVQANLGLVPPIAQRIHRRLPPSFELDDLISAGNFALIRAATRYRPRKRNAVPFHAYASILIRGAILESVRRGQFTAHTMLPIDDLPEHGDLPRFDIQIDGGRLRRRLTVAFQRLTPRQQAVLASFYSDSPPLPRNDATGRFLVRHSVAAAIGAALGLPEWIVTLEQERAIEELKRLLREAGYAA